MSHYFIDVATCARLSCVLTREEYRQLGFRAGICFDLAQDRARDDGLEVPLEVKPDFIVDNAGRAILEMLNEARCDRICRT